jgi:DNA-directed RNA polymerase sigma subunit (sigma70/sigma32)
MNMALGMNEIDWEGISLHDHSRYEKIRRVLNSELKDNLETVGLMESLDEVESAEEACERKLAVEGVRKAMNNKWSLRGGGACELSKRELKVLELYFFDGWNLTEIARLAEMSVESIRQIKNRTLQRLRHPKRVKILRELWESI